MRMILIRLREKIASCFFHSKYIRYEIKKHDLACRINIYNDVFNKFYKIPIGYIIVIKDIEEKTAKIYFITVDNTYRKKGIGSKLLLLMIDELRDDNIKIITGILKNKELFSFYEKIGFSVNNESLLYTIND